MFRSHRSGETEDPFIADFPRGDTFETKLLAAL